MTTLVSLSAVVKQRKGQGLQGAALAAAVAQDAASLPHLAVGTAPDPETVVLEMEGGIPVILLFNGYLEPAASMAPPPAPVPKKLTAGKSARVISAFGGWDLWAKHMGVLMTMFNAHDYAPTVLNSARVSDLRTPGFGDVNYINVHGSTGTLPGGAETTALSTASPVLDGEGNALPLDGVPWDVFKDLHKASDDFAENAADLAGGRLAYIGAWGPTPDHEGWVYGVTQLFIGKYWKMPAGSLVYLDVCQSASSAGLFPTLIGAGARSVWGWKNNSPGTLAYALSEAVFDRLLADTNTAHGDVAPDKIRHRPFDDADTYNNLKKTGNLTVTAGDPPTVRNLVRADASQPVLLRPTVSRVHLTSLPDPDVGPIYDRLDIYGNFASSSASPARSATLNGKALTCGGGMYPWTDSHVTCLIGKSSPSDTPSGPLVVEIDGRKSNPVPITRWTATLTYQLTGPGTMSTTVTCHPTFSADIHERLLKADGEPVTREPFYLQPDKDASFCTYTVSGSPGGGCGMLPVNQGSATSITIDARVDMSAVEADRLLLSMSAGSILGAYTVKCANVANPAALTITWPETGEAQDPLLGPTQFYFGINSATFELENRIIAKPISPLLYTFELSTTKPDSPPTKDTQE
jgi:hypothetical protein